MSRRLAREAAMSLLYERELNDEPCGGTLEEMKDVLKTDDFMDKHGDFVNGVIKAYDEHKDDIDALIARHCIGWSFDRIARVDVSVLRLAVAEICYLDTPVKVAVNEAVELTKKYSEDKSAGFVNGALASIIKELDKAPV